MSKPPTPHEIGLLKAIDAHRENSYGTDEMSNLEQKRALAIEAYLGMNNRPAPEGRSQVVDRSVYETISTLMPSLVKIFAASSEEVCKLVPVGPDDEPAADQATAVMNHVVTQLNPWEQIVGDWIFDAMTLCNGYCMAYWDKSDATVRESYEGQSDDQVAMLKQDSAITIVQHSERPDEQATADANQAYQQALQQWQEMTQQAMSAPPQPGPNGQPIQPPQLPPKPQKPAPVMLHDMLIERSENAGKVCIVVLPPEHCSVSVDTPDWTLKHCPYFEFRQQKTIAELRAMGLDVDDDISDDDSHQAFIDISRDRFGESSQQYDDFGKGVMRQVWARMIWVEADPDEEGRSQRWYVIAVGQTVLFSEETGRIPVASITPQPLPHRHIGMSTAETVMHVQDIKTAIKRGGLDNLYQSNSVRHAISDKVSLEDYLNSAPGGAVRLLNGAMPGDGHIVPLVHPSMFGEIIQSLEYFDQEKQNISGASRYFSGTDAGAINKTASGTIALQNMASMRVEHIARTMAPGIECLFEVVQEIVSKHQNKALATKLRGQWVTVDPQAWRTKRDVRISVGVGAGNKESMQAQLGQMLGAQIQLGPTTGLAGPNELFATVIEMAKLAGFANPTRFWSDPSTKPPQQPAPSPEQIKQQTEMQKLQFTAQQDQMRTQAEQQAEQQRLQVQAMLDNNREEMQARQKMLEMQQQADNERMKAEHALISEQRRLEFEQWKANLDAAVKLQIAGMAGDVSRETSQPKPDERLDQLMEIVGAIYSDLTSPTEFVRGPDGRAIGVKRGDKVRQIDRDPQTGRARGLH